MTQEISISCIVCAYNEEKAIHHTLTALRDVPNLKEIIVVDDGSHDRTAEIVRQYPFCRLLSLEKNGGKSRAFTQGFHAATGSHIMTLDADLSGLTAANIEALMEPVVSGKTDASLSLRGNSLLVYRMIGLDFVSGERVFPRSLIEHQIDSIGKLPGFGLESFVNDLLIQKQLSLSIVFWPNVLQMRKSEKMGFMKGTLAEMKMVQQVVRTIPLMKLAKQNIDMLHLKKK